MKTSCSQDPLKTYSCKNSATAFLGRVFVSLLFILGALFKIFYFRESVDILNNVGIYNLASFYVALALILELVGGVLLLLGWHTCLASLLLMIVLVPSTFIFHSFWEYQGMQAELQASLFFKNVAIFGALLLLSTFGPGRCSLDAKRCCATKCD